MTAVRMAEWTRMNEAERTALLDRKIWDDPAILDGARAIVERVRQGGDRAVLDFTCRFDGVELAPDRIAASPAELRAARERLTPAMRDTVDLALDNIRRVHAPQRPENRPPDEIAPGVFCGERWTPIDTVCLYIPRGRGAFASVACMLGVPASVAGVPRPVICTPPGPDGTVDAATLYVAERLGIDEVYRVGGAQAVAAVAFGTETIPRCDKIVGPGNVWVNGARQLLSRHLDPGPPAGPSESLIVGDGTADPENVAWNLLIEAEHGENSCAVLVTHDRAEADAVAQAAGRLLMELTDERRRYADEVLGRRGGIVVTENLEASCAFANAFAAEHVALMVSRPESVLSRIRHAGEILYGEFPVMSLANYVMGINAVLPTGGWARTASGVSVLDFMKRTSIGRVDASGFRALRDAVSGFSRDEGFSAHHLAVERWRPPIEKESS